MILFFFYAAEIVEIVYMLFQAPTLGSLSPNAPLQQQYSHPLSPFCHVHAMLSPASFPKTQPRYDGASEARSRLMEQ
jgi:hypothetical protein